MSATFARRCAGLTLRSTRPLHAAATPGLSSRPWFVSEEDESFPVPSTSTGFEVDTDDAPLVETVRAPPPPPDAPKHLLSIHSLLSQSPHIESYSVSVSKCDTWSHQPDPSEPHQEPSDEIVRPRGKTVADFVGEGTGNLWTWSVIAQVKEGTEGKGGIWAVLKGVRNKLATEYPQIPLPPKSASIRAAPDGWGLLDIGDSVVHIVSRSARDKWFTQRGYTTSM
ncbi:hypothetical protein BOTBODRAFT_140836 [Botryobasidium botryosum FD-172 SS1]|uniref:Uncharacterized protein n=1 Tax=Botryobasidium botryosum (strain FD-172 SS1) TaxID=930990 RepID=A0A067LUE8_BOTB1|nr:hypothetical protein BOTBODRAFT_140836 [Botryobasidium botryosum FD-172 SS1]